MKALREAQTHPGDKGAVIQSRSSGAEAQREAEIEGENGENAEGMNTGLSAGHPNLGLALAVRLFHVAALEANQIFFCMASAIHLRRAAVCEMERCVMWL